MGLILGVPQPLPAGRAREGPDATLLRELGQQIRVDAFRAAAMSAGAVTVMATAVATLSAADVVAVLLARHLRFDPDRPDDPAADHLLLASGRGGPLRPAALRAIGVIADGELEAFSRGEGRLPASAARSHPSPIETPAGTLGVGLAVATGISLAMQRLEPRASRIWLIGGDDELMDGGVWGAVGVAGAERLDALTLIVDVPRDGPTSGPRRGWETPALRRRFEAFEWRVLETDGHDVRAIDDALRTASATRFRPTVILARTIEGRGLRRTAGRPGQRGAESPSVDAAIRELGGRRELTVAPARPVGARARDRRSVGRRGASLPQWRRGDRVAIDAAIGEALVAIGTARPDIVVLDGHGDGATHLDRFGAVDARRYFRAQVDAPLLVGAAAGFSIRGWLTLAGIPASGVVRAVEAIELAAQSGLPLRILASGAGLGAGLPFATWLQQGSLGDVAALRAVNGAAILQPSDANQAALLVDALLDWPGVGYIRLAALEAATDQDGGPQVRTPPDDGLAIGGSREVVASAEDLVTVIASGSTVHDAVRAAGELESGGVPVRVIDAYSIKPLDEDSIAAAVVAADGRVVVVEDHRPEGGLGDAVAAALSARGVPVRLAHLAVRGTPAPGSVAERRVAAGIDAAAIVRAVRRLVADSGQ